jgi:hypothetical protein
MAESQGQRAMGSRVAGFSPSVPIGRLLVLRTLSDRALATQALENSQKERRDE